MSYTLSVKIELRDQEALAAAVADLKGRTLGLGGWKLFSSTEQGFGFTLPDWRYPLIATEAGALKFDDYHGEWGNVQDLDRLRERYAIHAGRLAAEAQGWYCEITQDGNLLIFHPTGGTLTVSPAGIIDAQGFAGPTCSEATRPIAEALGQTTGETRKEAYNQSVQGVGLCEE